MATLLEKIQRARESQVPAGGFKFRIRRPTDLEWFELQGSGPASRLLRFVVGWDGVRELDLFPGGDPTPAAFDHDVMLQFVGDRPDIMTTLCEAVLASYRAHVAQGEEAKKN
ncbi:MAG: hypothetical protein ACH37Z_14665 [Anaerolineae bacterium]